MSYLDKYLSELTRFSSRRDSRNEGTLAFHRAIKRDHNNNPFCLIDHDYGLRGTPAGGFSNKPEPVVISDEEDDDDDEDCVEITPHSILREHSYSLATLFTTTSVWGVKIDGGEECKSETVEEDVFADIIGSRFSDSSVIVDVFASLGRWPSITIDDDDSQTVDSAPSLDSSGAITLDDDSVEYLNRFPSTALNANDFGTPDIADHHSKTLPSDLSALLEEVLKEPTVPDAISMRTKPEKSVSQRDDAHSDDELLATIHVCKVCGSRFELRSALLKHYRSHERDKKSMTCPHCGTSFHSTVKLLIHRKRHEKCKSSSTAKDGSTSTSVIRRRRSSSSNSFSEDTIPPKVNWANNCYRCLHCSKPFFNFSQLVAHQENHHSDKDQLYKCPICAESFQSLDQLIHHGNEHKEDIQESHDFSNAHESNSLASSVNSSTATACVKTTTRNQRKRMVCIYCNESFTDAERLAEHGRIHQKVKKKLTCSFCCKVFDDQNAYSHHQLAHIKERNCYFVPAIENPAGLDAAESRNSVEPQHYNHRSVHSGSQEISAVQELIGFPGSSKKDRVSSSSQSPVSSEKAVLKIEPPDQFFLDDVNLNYNYLQQDQVWLTNVATETSTDVANDVASDVVLPKSKDFVCPDCDVAFASLSRLGVHARRCHPYACQDCKRTFQWLDELNAHRQVYFMKPCYRWSRCPNLAFSHQKS